MVPPSKSIGQQIFDNLIACRRCIGYSITVPAIGKHFLEA